MKSAQILPLLCLASILLCCLAPRAEAGFFDWFKNRKVQAQSMSVAVGKNSDGTDSIKLAMGNHQGNAGAYPYAAHPYVAAVDPVTGLAVPGVGGLPVQGVNGQSLVLNVPTNSAQKSTDKTDKDELKEEVKKAGETLKEIQAAFKEMNKSS